MSDNPSTTILEELILSMPAPKGQSKCPVGKDKERELVQSTIIPLSFPAPKIEANFDGEFEIELGDEQSALDEVAKFGKLMMEAA